MRWKDIEELGLEPIDLQKWDRAVNNIIRLSAENLRYYRRKDVEPVIIPPYLGIKILPRDTYGSIVDSEVLRLNSEVYIVRSRWVARFHSSSAVWFYKKTDEGWARLRLNKEIRQAMELRLAVVALTGRKKN